MLKRLFFKKKVRENDKLINKIEELSLKQIEINSLNDELLKCIAKVNNIAENQYEVVSITKTKYDEFVICYCRYELLDLEYRSYQFKIDTLYSGNVLSLYLEIDIKMGEIYIIDIQNSNKVSKGYGTVAMEHLFKLADKLNINEVKGDLYTLDSKNKLRQESFYKKYYFNFTNSGISWTRSKDKHPFGG